ncbi:uncharacterized protein LOC130649244 isoform X2 [Hydractinia symbiolongicarpus]|uniref:uncharacterized protein LOC130649244 isoform X2 n=1 Tax=Hydractinia symbiolongicarpus TaxID=13093 RepID=UPI0025502101|nr:uncharacterized protein LOC130649244 isoform X2 [Hydractinia symbiolongicarpus]
MDSLYRSECTCTSSYSPGSSCKPQNKYLSYLLDEFEKCSQQSSDLSRLQKENVSMKKEIAEAQREIRDLKFEKQLLSEKVSSMQREMQEQKLLHSQLRDESSSEFRSLYRKCGNQEKDVDLLKYQMKMGAKKHALDLENLRWELTATQKYGVSSYSPVDFAEMSGNDKL